MGVKEYRAVKADKSSCDQLPLPPEIGTASHVASQKGISSNPFPNALPLHIRLHLSMHMKGLIHMKENGNSLKELGYTHFVFIILFARNLICYE